MIRYFGLAVLSWFLTGATLFAQRVVEAELGEPMGVAEVVIQLDDADRRLYRGDGFYVNDLDNRISYPVFSVGTLRRFFGEIASDTPPEPVNSINLYFLFTGDKPFSIEVVTSKRVKLEVVPQRGRARVHPKLFKNWWREFSGMARVQKAAGDYPPIVEEYLTAMLANRWGLEPPPLERAQAKEEKDPFTTIQDLLLGTDEFRIRQMRATMKGETRDRLTQPLPANTFQVRTGNAEGEKVPVEKLAEHVPEECYYVRFGSWSNYVWLKSYLRDRAADLSRVVQMRSYDIRLDDRIQNQLGVSDSAVMDLLGGTLVADIGIIGTDTYFREGAAMGVLLQAKNGLLLPAIKQQRSLFLKKWEVANATEETIRFGKEEATLISTPDNRIRSFLASSGNAILITNSRYICERFLAASQGDKSLANSRQFQQARAKYPIRNDDAMFVYMSPAFFQKLLSPEYQVELQRRVVSATDIELVYLAKMAAAGEQIAAETVVDLIRTGYLPRNFEATADESGLIVTDDLIWDSLRGVRGTFVPIPDISVKGANQFELTQYQETISYFQNWFPLDQQPVIAYLRKESADQNGLDTIRFHLEMTELGEQQNGWLTSMLGPPVEYRVVPGANDAIHVQASLKGGLLFPNVPPHQVFAAVQDDQAPRGDFKDVDLKKLLTVARTTPGYLGAWPKPGFLDFLPFIGGAPDPEGFTRSLLGIWRWQGNEASILSLEKDRLNLAASGFQVEGTDDPAQIRIAVKDLSSSALRPWLEEIERQRFGAASVSNARLLNSVVQQLEVPGEQALSAVELALDAKLVCPLKGEYQLSPSISGNLVWRSEKLDSFGAALNPEFESHLLAWFRGLNASISKQGATLTADVELKSVGDGGRQK